MNNNVLIRTVFLFLVMIAVPLSSLAINTDELKVYGKLKLSVNSVDDGDAATTSVSNNSSRIGIKGSRGLTPGVKAIYQIELGVDAAQRSTSLSGRNSYAGLKGNIGQVFIGQHDTPMKKVRSHGAELFDDTVAGSRAIISAIANATGDKLDNRAKNMVGLKSPKFGGHTQLFVMYSADMQATSGPDDNKNDLQGYSITFNNGKFYSSLGYEIRENGASAPTDTEAMRLGLSYKGGMIGFGALFETSDKGSNDPLTRDAFAINGRVNFTKSTWFGLQYAVADDFDGTPETGAYSIMAGLMSKLGKNTTVYVVGISTVNDDNASYGISQGGIDDRAPAAAPGENVIGLSVGMAQNF